MDWPEQNNRWRVRLPGCSGGPHHWVLDVPSDETETVAVEGQCSLQDGSHASGAEQRRSGRGEYRSLGWPRVRNIEHPAHAPGHAALLIEERGVLVAGDMLSDVLIPMLDDTADPIEDYLVGLRLLEGVADDVDVVIPGHGSVGRANQVRARIEQDRASVQALRDGGGPNDPRMGPSAKPGWEWVSDIHAGQLQNLGPKRRTQQDARIEIRLRAPNPRHRGR
jgi:glyoxylase-like metal-dependent hydrolase (beta-lactamase superfamily II)